MAFALHIDTNNAAFDDGEGFEVARLLREVAEQVEYTGFGKGYAYDMNGNRVGKWTFEAPEFRGPVD